MILCNCLIEYLMTATTPTDMAKGLLAGGLANMIPATAMNPLDVCKVKMQSSVLYGSLFRTASLILREEGLVRGLFMPGMTATIMREMSYSSFRFGFYQPIKTSLATLFPNTTSRANKSGNEPFAMKLASGVSSWMFGSCLANPTDVVKIRLQTEASRVKDGLYVTGLKKGFPPKYRNTFHAFLKIYRDEGFSGLYKGVHVTVLRASVLTGTQLASYDETKYLLKKHNILDEGLPLHVISSVVAGFVTTTACAPTDIIKTRLLSQSSHDPAAYKGIYDCLTSLIRKEGFPYCLEDGCRLICDWRHISSSRCLFTNVSD
ncbi:mitochondrial carrier domain-containing protein [Chytridium lagenaria]|nr:mitochondrial carrier domain-containing protein [Chytridium lagenaria]